MICLFLKSNEALREVTLATQYTEGLGVKFVAEPKAAVEGKTLKWEAIAKEEQVTVLGSTNFHKPTPSSALSMNGHIEYKVEGQEEMHALDFEIPFNFVEMVRETPMTATAYFEMWKSYKAEQKVEIHSSLRNTRLFAEKANKLFHVAIVDVNDVCRRRWGGVIASEDHFDGRKGRRHELALPDGGEHDVDGMHDLLQGPFIRAVQTAGRRVEDVYGELSSLVC